VIAAALGAFVYFYEIRGEEGRKAAEEVAKQLFGDVDATAIDVIEFTSEDGRGVRLERREERWRIARPIDFPADAFAADGIATALAEISSEQVLEDPQPPEVYGLGEAARVVRFEADGVVRDLRLGRGTPVGSNTYASTGEEGRVYVVATSRTSGLQRSLEDLREKRVLPFDPDAVVRIEVAWPGDRVALERGEEGWKLVAPFAYRADEHTVDELLDAVSVLRASGFVDEALTDAEAGLAPAALRVELMSEADDDAGESPEPLRLALSETRSDGKQLARGAEGALYEVGSTTLAGFPPRRVVSYQWKELSSFDDADAQGFEIDFADPDADAARYVVTAENAEVGWTTQPDTLERGRAFGIVSELSSLRANQIVAESMGDAELAALGLNPPRVALRVFGGAPDEDDAPVLADVHLGELDPQRGIPAKAADRDAVYRLSANVGELIPLSLEAYRNRFVAEEPEEASEEPAAEATSEEAPIED
jgi:hypothetical protein